MKMNKLAAGALALALGLGAVAPAVAAETGTSLVQFEYNEQLAEAQKFFTKREEARKTVKAAEARYEAAKKAEAAAAKKYKDLPADKKDSTPKTSASIQNEIDGTKFDDKGNIVPDDQHKGLKKLAAEAAKKVQDAQKAYDDDTAEDKDTAAQGTGAKLEAAKLELKKAVAALDKANAELAEAIKKEKEGLPELDKNKLAPKAQALVDLMKAQEELSNSYSAYGIALDNEKAINDKYKKEFGRLLGLAEAAGYIVKVEGSKIVVKPAKTETKSVAEAVKALKASIDDNKAAVKSAEFLLQNAPKSVAKVKAKLEAQIVKAKAAITKGEAALAKVEKKMAFIATAYAAEDDVKVEDLEALTKENKESASDINNTIKENEKEQPAVEEEKKPEEKKPEENKPARKAGKNAKTGIAGIAGVAGILAAASVAYAASKRD